MERCRDQRLAFGLALDLARRLDGGWAPDLTIGVATGVGLNGDVTVEVDLGKVLGTNSSRILESGQDGDTWEVGNDVGGSKVEFEEMDLRFTLPPPENPDHYQY